MRYYTNHKVTSHDDVSIIISELHKSGVDFGFYFIDGLLRTFSNHHGTEVPVTNKFITTNRVRSAERQTSRQKEKRMKRLKEHLAKKGIKYVANKQDIKADFDYFLNIFSYSSRNSFRLHIKNTVVFEEKQGDFNSYGLSIDGSTLPLF